MYIFAFSVKVTATVIVKLTMTVDEYHQRYCGIDDVNATITLMVLVKVKVIIMIKDTVMVRVKLTVMFMVMVKVTEKVRW